ncbi:MAG: phosphomannomutase/phosphoglucomutase [bacterium]|nr:phosphomannomutase/phosphoglucomutase [bacterium]
MSEIESVFHAYDIRGLSPDILDEDFARKLGNACVAQFSPTHVCIGRDMRGTSVNLEKALIDALLAHGVNVTRIGLCSTPMFNVSVGLANGMYDLGIMVTASHNPAEFNGFKFVRGDVSPIGQGSGMEELQNAFFEHGDDTGSGNRGELSDDKDALKMYVSHVLKLAKLPPDMPKMRVAIDAGNGMAGVVLPELIQRLPWLRVEPLFFELDGTFPNHEANPIKPETLADLERVLTEGSFECGAGFDGDADRVGFMDELGNPISGDIATAILARPLLRVHSGGEILYDVRSSWVVPETILASGGKPTMCRVGHSFIKQQMRESSALFGGEVSMHYYFSELNNVESSDLSLLLLLKEMVHEGRPLSAIAQDLAVYAHSGEINFRVRDPHHVINTLKTEYASHATEIIEIDGIRLEFRNASQPDDDWWFSLRASNTESLLRLNLETRTRERTNEKVKMISKKIRLA